MNLGTLIPRHATCRPTHTAVVFDSRRLTYLDLEQRVNRLANALLARGLRKGDRVATVLPNCLELLDLYWAAARTGLVVVPMSPLLTARGLAGLLRDSGSRAVFASAAFAAALDGARPELPGIAHDAWFLIEDHVLPGYISYRDFVSHSPDMGPPDAAITGVDPYNIIYSSGTTGDPKGIVHTHYVRGMYCALFASSWRMTPESVVLHTGSIVFNGAFVTLMPCFYLGATYVLHKAFDPGGMMGIVSAEKVTHVMMVPSQIAALLDHPDFDPDALASLEMILSLGAPLPSQHKQRLEAALPGRLYELYGLTEGFVTVLDPADRARKPDSVGVPPPFFEMQILDDAGNPVAAGEIGEIAGRGPILMPGYHQRPDLTQETIVDGWLRSGDLGYVDEDGFLYLVDRKKDMIISGGVNVYPRDIEEVAVQHPAVSEAAVFGVPDDRFGETPVAAVILKPGASAAAPELREWINGNVGAKFQRVREVLVVADLPRNAAAKTLKRVLREDYLASRD